MGWSTRRTCSTDNAWGRRRICRANLRLRSRGLLPIASNIMLVPGGRGGWSDPPIVPGFGR